MHAWEEARCAEAAAANTADERAMVVDCSGPRASWFRSQLLAHPNDGA